MNLIARKDEPADFLLGDSSVSQRPLPRLWILELHVTAAIDPCSKRSNLPLTSIESSLGFHVAPQGKKVATQKRLIAPIRTRCRNAGPACTNY